MKPLFEAHERARGLSVRARLFFLLLALSVLPLLGLRLYAQHHFRELTADLVQRSRHMLIGKAKASMRMMVEDHAEMWRREGLLLEQTLRIQAMEVEEALSGKEPMDLMEAYHTASRPAGLSLLGQITVFEDGRAVPSGESVRLPRRFDGREALWYTQALKDNALVWTAPVIDPVTRRVGLTLSMPVRDGSGKIVGVTALTAPLAVGGPAREHAAGISLELKTYLVDYAHPDSDKQGLRIVAQAGGPAPEDEMNSMPGMMPRIGGHRMGMMGLTTPKWLIPDNPEDQKMIMEDLRNGLSEVRQTAMGDKDYLWAYAPTGIKGAALVVVAPKKDVISDAVQASNYIEGRIREQMTETLTMFLAAMAVIFLAAWFLSRTVTRPIRDLAEASRRLGHGDFTARVVPSGGREFMALGQAFNRMVPNLEERTRMKNALAMAREVHSRLLPQELPLLPGLDLAGTSIPCEETGGDAFDVITAAHGLSDRTAALVGDVSGHGLDAALLMATARAFLRMRARQPGSPAQVATDVNRYLALDTVGSGRFMTLFYLELDFTGRELRWVRAGHDPALLYQAATDGFEELGGPGIPLGVLTDREFADSARPWPDPGDVLLIGSDGLWETRGPDGSMFGKDRVRDIMRRHAGQSAREILDALIKAHDEFRGNVPVEDDVTLLVIKSIQEEDEG